jgi:hypothetical protein
MWKILDWTNLVTVYCNIQQTDFTNIFFKVKIFKICPYYTRISYIIKFHLSFATLCPVISSYFGRKRGDLNQSSTRLRNSF